MISRHADHTDRQIASLPARTKERVVKAIVSDVPTGAVARHKGWWGVMGRWHNGARRFHRWDADDIRLWPYEVVEMLEQTVQQTTHPKDDSGSRA